MRFYGELENFDIFLKSVRVTASLAENSSFLVLVAILPFPFKLCIQLNFMISVCTVQFDPRIFFQLQLITGFNSFIVMSLLVNNSLFEKSCS